MRQRGTIVFPCAGDVFAWVHQSVAEENELLQNFFDKKVSRVASDTDSMRLIWLRLCAA